MPTHRPTGSASTHHCSPLVNAEPSSKPAIDGVQGASKPTVLLQERPPDAVPQGGHSRVARALVETVAEERGGAIALVGPYGSGKSTVVDYARHLLSEDPNVDFVTIDAWAHRADPLLRIALSRLLERAKGVKHFGSRGELAAAAERLGPPRSTSQRTTSSGLTGWGTWVAVLVAALPLIYAFIEPSAQNFDLAIGEWKGQVTSEPAYIGPAWAVLSVSLVALAAWGAATLRERRRRDRRLGSDTDTSGGGIFQQTVVVETVETVGGGEPTSVEFEQSFRQLMDIVLRDPARRVVLVVDDLDRLSAAEAQDVWRTLRLFADAAKGQPWRQRFWTVVALTDGTLDDQARLSTGAVASSDDDRRDDERGGDPEVWQDKSFVAVLRVPPFVPSEGATFLLTQLEEGFPNHTPAQRVEVVRVHTYLRPGAHPPRRLRRFVNDLVMSYRQHGDSVPLPGQAAFLLGGVRKFKPSPTDADVYAAGLDREQLERVLGAEGLLDASWHRTAATLEFGVGIELAAQVLASGPIARAIEEGDGPGLRAAVSSPHVLGAVVLAVREAALSGSARVVDNAARALSGLDAEVQNSAALNGDGPVSEAWRLLDAAVADLADLSLPDTP